MASVLVIGNGAREHALLWKLSQSSKVASLFIFPGNSAIESAASAKCANITNVGDHQSVIDFCQKQKVSLVLIGPEQPLAAGIVDSLTAAGIACFGPSAKAAQIESSKAFSKDFMVQNGIPTARFRNFKNPVDAKAFLQSDQSALEYLVVKASGLALGKGVVVANSVDEAIAAVDYVSQFGDNIILEEKLSGEEISALCFTDGLTIKTMPFAQDHKRLLDDDEGPNTGGMGAYAPYPLISSTIRQFIEDEILLKTITCLKKERIEYRGVLYAGLMLTREGPKVLEFNCRFGDPETQVLIPLLRSDLYDILESCVTGRLGEMKVLWANNEYACGVVLASSGYPNSPVTGFVIAGLDHVNQLPNRTVFYAGMKRNGDNFVTSGGRVLCTVGVGSTLADAAMSSLSAAKQIQFDGRQFRTDIGRKVMKRLYATKSLTYANAGVNIDAGDALVQSIKSACASTSRPGSDVVELGGFGALFDLRKAGFKDPVLISGTDGVGTKLAIAQECGDHDTIGIDLVAMCVNDILTQAAEPLFFLDYYATGKLSVEVAAKVVKGIAAGCMEAKCALIGGETAEMPGFYSKCEYDLAGFAVGAVERDNFLDLTKVSAGDVILGLPSSGLHSNGFSLVRKVIREKASLRYSDTCPWDSTTTVGRAVLIPTKIYVRELTKAFQKKLIKAAAHITGGGLTENIPRILPSNAKVVLDMQKWPVQKIFTYLQQTGRIPAEEMVRAFNCGIGFVLVVSPNVKEEVKKTIQTENGQVFEIGRVEVRQKHEKVVEIAGLESVFRAGAVNGYGIHNGKKRVAVLISGSGTNLKALIDYPVTHAADYEIALVISNVPEVKGLERAQSAGILTKVIRHEKKTRQAFEDEIHDVLVKKNIEFVCLAGFMRILTEGFVKKWTGRMINVHPSLLPSFKGAHAHQLALKAKVRLTGCTVHFVEPEVDAGAIILQGSALVYPKDTEETLSERVKLVEHQIYPKALDALAKGSVRRGEDGEAHWISDEALEAIMA